MAFNETFFQEILQKKEEFENMAENDQHEFSSLNFNSEILNSEISFTEVSKAIDRAKLGKAYL